MKTVSKLSAAILTSLLFSSAAIQAATQQQIDAALAPVKSAAMLQATLSQPSALDALGDELPAFIASIQFSNAAGQATFDNSQLQTNLTATEVYQILALFGQQSTIGQYPDALAYSDTDRLLLENAVLPFCSADSPIKLRVILKNDNQVKFNYRQAGVACDGNVELTENTSITYKLVHTKRTPKGLRITGAGFANPFDAHIKRVTVSDDGQSLTLENDINNPEFKI
ncbi:DP-EP family protein [Shewanella sp. KX20019]|uniref:DP-EP family protein n=1 Tax=Shewanella sp. KX20019 TaxID=2803864 RepID=UPI0019280291|nr:DP-EP family protein [Shewanella sp. KX20019]QQX79623.1 DP-EP family protein [Shewanella sp. KX20019]